LDPGGPKIGHFHETVWTQKTSKQVSVGDKISFNGKIASSCTYWQISRSIGYLVVGQKNFEKSENFLSGETGEPKREKERTKEREKKHPHRRQGPVQRAFSHLGVTILRASEHFLTME
jgi:hypothetical protein